MLACLARQICLVHSDTSEKKVMVQRPEPKVSILNWKWLGSGGYLAEFCSAALTEQRVGRISCLAVVAYLWPLHGSSSWSVVGPWQNRILHRGALQRPVRQNRAIAS